VTHESTAGGRSVTLRAAAALFVLALAAGAAAAPAQQRAESREQWFRDGQRTVDEAARLKPITRRAKNVILFVGDGMGISTITAARILDGQLRGGTGEENSLSFERLPYVALSKTYSVNQQTPDSAPTMTAIVTGVKTEDAMLSVDQDAVLGDHTTAAGNELPTLLEIAEQAGLSTGVVTTATVTHATPGACYAHTPHRGWEDDSNLSPAAKAAGFPDIARQLVEFPYGDGLEVALGGGRAHFLPSTAADPEDAEVTGNRTDGRDLTKEWSAKRPRSAYIWNKAQFDAVDPARTDHLLGLFEPSQMKHEADRANDKAKEPSLTEMTVKAIDLLSRNRRGYFLMVEGGRIDHAHHGVNAYRALTDTIELSHAVPARMCKVVMCYTLSVIIVYNGLFFTIT
jgi:alkaline phosphatase